MKRTKLDKKWKVNTEDKNDRIAEERKDAEYMRALCSFPVSLCNMKCKAI